MNDKNVYEWKKEDIRKNTNAKSDFEKDLFKLVNDPVFGKAMENVRKYRDVKLVINDGRRIYFALERNYHITTFQKILYQ